MDLKTCFLIVWLFGCSSLRLRTEPGQQVGASVRSAALQSGNEAAQNGGRSDFQKGYADTVASKEMVLVNPEVSKVIQEANGLAASLTERDPLCERRWAAKCPDGWTLAGEDQCVAPASYGGACKTMQSFMGKSTSEKQRVAEDCKAPWPCNDCPEGHDYSVLCPEGWNDDGGGFCKAPADFETKCATSYDFATMDIATKEELAETCGFKWSCATVCDQDFGAACPDGWSEVQLNPGICVAPATYSGSCSFSANTTRMTSHQKEAFAKKCGVKFPCLGAAAVAAAADAEERNAGLMPDGPVDFNGRITSVLRTPIAPNEARAPALRNITKMFQAPSGPLSA